MEKVSERRAAVAEALSLVKKRQKDGELGYEQQNTLAYLEAVSKLSAKDSEALFKELTAMGLSELVRVSLTAVLPKKEDDVRQVAAADGTSLTEEQIKEIIKKIKEYAK